MTSELPALPPPDDIPAVSAEELVDGVAEPQDEEPRRYPSTIGGLFYLAVLAVSAVGFGFVLAGHWRTGVRLLGLALLFAAVVRLALSNRNAGMLAVRHKGLDALVLTALGGTLLALASTIPNQPG